MSVLHYFGKATCVICSSSRRKLVSLGAGAVLSYIIVHLIPLTRGVKGPYFVLAGFLAFLASENFLYKHAPRNKLKGELRALHESIIFIINFTGGIILFSFWRESFSSALLWFIPFLFIAISEDFSLHFIHGKEKKISQFISSSAFLIGIASAIIFGISESFIGPIIGIISGILLFIVTNETMNEGKNIDIMYFIAGSVMLAASTIFWF